MTTRWDSVTVDGETMRCYVAVPAGEGPFPAVVLLHGCHGVSPQVRNAAAQILMRGKAGGDDDDVRAGRVGIVVRARDRAIVPDDVESIRARGDTSEVRSLRREPHEEDESCSGTVDSRAD